MAFGGRRSVVIIMALLILINVIALALTSASIRMQVYNHLLVRHQRFGYDPLQYISDGAGGLYITENDDGNCYLHHLGPRGGDIRERIHGWCYGLLDASVSTIVVGYDVRSSYDIVNITYSPFVETYQNGDLTRYDPSITFDVKNNASDIRMLWNYSYTDGNRLYTPGLFTDLNNWTLFMWVFDFQQENSTVTRILSLELEDAGDVESQYHYPDMYYWTIGDAFLYFDFGGEQSVLQVLSETNRTEYAYDNGEISINTMTELSVTAYSCFVSDTCEVFEVQNNLIFFELDRTSDQVIRTYNGQEERINIPSGHYIYRIAGLHREDMILMTTGTAYYEEGFEMGDYLYAFAASGQDLYEYSVLINPYGYESPRYSTIQRDENSFYVITQKYVKGEGVTEFVLSSVSIDALQNLSYWGDKAWRISLPTSLMILGVTVFLYRRNRGKAIEELYPS